MNRGRVFSKEFWTNVISERGGGGGGIDPPSAPSGSEGLGLGITKPADTCSLRKGVARFLLFSQKSSIVFNYPRYFFVFISTRLRHERSLGNEKNGPL